MVAPFNFDKTMNLEITKEEALNLAAQKIAEQYADLGDLEEKVHNILDQRIKELFASRVNALIENFLTEEMTRIVSTEIIPVNIWGEREGEPTTIRTQLAKRAKEFWEVRVNEDGKPSSYGGSPRSEQLMRKILAEEFSKAVKHNADTIVAAFKAALLADATRMVKENIERLIK